MASVFDPDDARIGAVRRLSALETVRARIGLAIDLGLLRPGQPLPRTDSIAEAFDVGIATVRRALSSLSADGVVVRVRGRAGGTYVADNPRHVALASELETARADVVALIDQRLALECGLTHLAVDRLDAAVLPELDGLVDQMAEVGDWSEFHLLDVRFHRLVAHQANLPGAFGSYTEVTDALYRYYLPYPMKYLRASNLEHRELMDALAAGDRVRAHDVTVRHVDILRETMFTGLTRDES